MTRSRHKRIEILQRSSLLPSLGGKDNGENES
jgi:hypothetical protein